MGYESENAQHFQQVLCKLDKDVWGRKMSETAQTLYVQMTGISKQFGDVAANEDVHLDVRSGEIHALLGENGAGKSTLMNMLAGIYNPDKGSIYIHGKRVQFHSPEDAIKAGIGMIHQHFKLVEVLSAADNIIGGQKGSFFIHRKKVRKEITTLMQRYGLEIDPEKRPVDMSVGEKQTLEILKVLYRGADILVMDEPTAVLTPQEAKKLFSIIRNMRDNGCAVIIITHKMQEVLEISDRVTVLRKGRTVQTVQTVESNQQLLTDLMVGHAVNLSISRPAVSQSGAVLSLANVSSYANDKRKLLDNISFDLHGGEILGIAGVANSGQKELCEAIAGLIKVQEGDIDMLGNKLIGMTPRSIARLGVSMSFVPEDRLGMGLVASMGIVDNMMLKNYRDRGRFFLNRKPASSRANHIVSQLDIMTPGILHPVKNLSGGNIQKVLLGREIASNPHVLITAYPVRGLDINASHNIYDLLNAQKKNGVGILFIGEDLDVLMAFCDRIMVLHAGKINGIVAAHDTTKEALGAMMSGVVIQKGEQYGSSDKA